MLSVTPAVLIFSYTPMDLISYSILNDFIQLQIDTTVIGNVITCLLTPWSRALLEKLTGFQIVKKFPAFYGTRRFITALTSVRHLSYPGPARSSPIPEDPSLYYHVIYAWVSQVVSYPQISLPNSCIRLSFPPYALHVPPISFFSIWWPEQHWVKSKVPEACVHDLHQTQFLRWIVVNNSPNLQAGGSPLVGSQRLLIQYIRSHPPYWRPFLQPQPEDAPCRGDRDPLITAVMSYCDINSVGHNPSLQADIHSTCK